MAMPGPTALAPSLQLLLAIAGPRLLSPALPLPGLASLPVDAPDSWTPVPGCPCVPCTAQVAWR